VWRGGAGAVLTTVHVVGWSAPNGVSIHVTRSALAQHVVEVAGRGLRGSIRWRIVKDEEAHRLLDDLLRDSPPVFVAHCDQVRACLADRGGWVLVAEAPVEIEESDG
jgi:hypothetical protein